MFSIRKKMRPLIINGHGNAVVPQVAELIGHWIAAHADAEQEQRKAA